MNVLQIALITALALYCLLMLAYAEGWGKIKEVPALADLIPRITVSVIIPARNEALNIAACLQAITKQDYPKELLEVIVIDDHSEDSTAAIAEGFSEEMNVKVLALKDYTAVAHAAYKKAALGLGIAHSSGALIITTDADCIALPTWISAIAEARARSDAAAIVAPVAYSPVNGLSGIFQSLDFMTMQGITAAVHYRKLGAMANGANFAFTRDAYEAVDGYTNTTHLASGDDYHLLQKIQRLYPRGVHYLKSKAAIVSTPPQPGWRSFLQQRIRWASKSGKDGDARLAAMLLLVYVFNVLLLATGVAAVFFPGLWCTLGLVLGIKLTAELILLWPVSGFFGKHRELIAFPLLQPLHIVYVVLAGFLGMMGKYKWKGRTVR